MKIFKLTLKSNLRISIRGEKKDYKKGFTFLTMSISEFKRYAPYCESQVITVDDKKFLKLIEGNLDKLDGEVKDLVKTYKEDADEAQKRIDDELARRKKLAGESDDSKVKPLTKKELTEAILKIAEEIKLDIECVKADIKGLNRDPLEEYLTNLEEKSKRTPDEEFFARIDNRNDDQLLEIQEKLEDDTMDYPEGCNPEVCKAYVEKVLDEK